MLKGDTLKKGEKETPTERQQSGGRLLRRKENVVYTSEAPESIALLQNHIHIDNKQSTKGGRARQRGNTVNILLLSTKMHKMIFPKLLSFTYHFHSLLLYLHILLFTYIF